MPTLHLRLHPGLIPDAQATWRQRHRTPHLRQGDLDGSCGASVVLTALIILRLATWAEVRTLRILSPGRLEETYSKCLETFFGGSSDADMFELLDTLRGTLRYRVTTGSMRRVRDFALARLRLDELVIVGINPWGTRRGHWVLGVGAEIVSNAGSRAVIGILCLDPAEPSPLVAPFNGKLDLESPATGARHVHYRTAGSIRNVTCKIAIALSLRR